MTESTPSAGQLKFKSPASDEWRALPVDGQDKEQQEKTKAARDTLKETLLTSLQMQHIVVLAGSGTSLGPVGGPSMKDLWDAAIGKPPTQDATCTAKKINYDLKVLTPNIEEFLSKSEAYLQVMDDTDVKSFVNSCKKVILEMCSTFLNVEKLEAHKTFLHRLSRRRVRDPRLKVFTTNYDLCFEQAASALGGVVIDGFSFAPPRHYDPRYFGYDIIRRPRASEDQGRGEAQMLEHFDRLITGKVWKFRHEQLPQTLSEKDAAFLVSEIPQGRVPWLPGDSVQLPQRIPLDWLYRLRDIPRHTSHLLCV